MELSEEMIAAIKVVILVSLLIIPVFYDHECSKQLTHLANAYVWTSALMLYFMAPDGVTTWPGLAMAVGYAAYCALLGNTALYQQKRSQSCSSR